MGTYHKVIILKYFSKKEDFYIEEVRNSLKGKVRKLKSIEAAWRFFKSTLLDSGKICIYWNNQESRR